MAGQSHAGGLRSPSPPPDSAITKLCDLEKGPNPLWPLVPTSEKGRTKEPLRVVDNMSLLSHKEFWVTSPWGTLDKFPNPEPWFPDLSKLVLNQRGLKLLPHGPILSVPNL